MSWTKRQLGLKSRIQRDENRLKVFMEIYKKPSTFTELLEQTNLSRASLSKHLKNLEKEDAVKRTLQGRHIIYEANKSQTAHEIKINFLNSFIKILMDSFPALDRELQAATNEFAEKIQESIRKYETEDKQIKIWRRSVKVPKGTKKIKMEIAEAGKTEIISEDQEEDRQ